MIASKRVRFAVCILEPLLTACAAQTESAPSPAFNFGHTPDASGDTTAENDTDVPEAAPEPTPPCMAHCRRKKRNRWRLYCLRSVRRI